jgi:hypothetical protein
MWRNLPIFAGSMRGERDSYPTFSDFAPRLLANPGGVVLAWSKNPICMASKSDGGRGPGGAGRGVTLPYIAKKSPRNIGMVPWKPAWTMSRVFSEIEVLDNTGS